MRHFTGSVSDKGGCRLMPAIIPVRLRVYVYVCVCEGGGMHGWIQVYMPVCFVY